MRRFFRPIPAALLGLGIFAQPAVGQTCAQLKAEIANLQQTLANEQRSLANCNNHLGSCTPGQISGIQQAIQIAQQEIAADEARLGLACAPPPPPNFDHVSLQGTEVVQAVQDTANSVKLLAGKTTWVRVYLDKTDSTRQITATLQASRGGSTVNISPVASIIVDASENLQTRRTNWSKSLNFAVPAAMITSGTTIFTLTSVIDPSPSHKTIICANCSNPTQVSFFNAPALVIRAIGLSYQFTPSPGAPPQTANPRVLDFTLLQSWLGRAYPVSTVTFSQTTVASTSPWPFTCTQANAQLAAIRATDIAAGRDNHTHYLGLVSNQGGFLRGCASGIPATADPTVTAAAPSGPTSGANVPVNVNGDPDGSFADWYGGHELAHTFGRSHPGFCNGNSASDPSFPYPNGQISNGTDTSFAGLDTGDTPNTIALAVLWGGSTFDIMTYCQQPQWLSAYTYAGVNQRLLDENPGFKESLAHRRGKETQVVGTLVQVVATLNLTQRTGTIDFVTPLSSAPTPVGTTGHAELVVRDVTGREVFRQSVSLRLMTDIPEGEDQMALVDAALPFREDMAEIDLVLDGTVLAQYKNAQTTPPAITGFKATRDPDESAPTATWDPSPAAAGKVTFTVQTPGSDVPWVAIAVGLADPKFTLSADQAKTPTLRITANNGFRSSQPVVFNLCPNQIDQVASQQAEVNDLQEAIASGEVPPPPRTPQAIAQVRAQLAKLVRALAVARAQLAKCQAPKP